MPYPRMPLLLADLAGAGLDVSTRELDRHARAHDASHFSLLPEAVAVAGDLDQIRALLRRATTHRTPLTWRSGGTSLSGQGVTDGLLVDVRRRFGAISVLDDGRRVRVQPGATVRQVNQRLRGWGRRLGPDPASESACTIGGVIANNSSGMLCGTTENAYQTLESMVLVLATGTVVDTGDPEASARLRAAEPTIAEGLERLRDRVRSDPRSVATVRAQFARKNTMGYAVNAFLDFDDPVAILAHLLVGSEGTLGFVAEATFRTVPVAGHAATGLLHFESLDVANDLLPTLIESGAAAIELMDAAALGTVRDDLRDRVGLLVEYQATSAEELAAVVDRSRSARTRGTAAARLTEDPTERAALWSMRKGLYAAVAGARPPGTAALLEDVAVPVDRMTSTCAALTWLFAEHRYPGAVIFGHAKDGNLHFMLADRFADPEAIVRYGAFTEDLVDLVLGAGGTLKAEHGTGRVMAPFVGRQYGPELYDVMREVKALLDPALILNPGVVITADTDVHLKHLKVITETDEIVDRCVECGFCEPVCPSRTLTLTPRQRIVARRAISAAEGAGDRGLAQRLERAYEYDGVQTCAADGMCQTVCPVGIDTGDLARRLRARSVGPVGERVWASLARRWDTATGVAGGALTAAGHAPASASRLASHAARALVGPERAPAWAPGLPPGGGPRKRPHQAGGAAIYLPSCVNRVFGPEQGSGGVQVALERLCRWAGLSLQLPDGIDSLCCAVPWSSKGLGRGAASMRAQVRDTITALAADGPRAVISDASSCSDGFAATLRDTGVEVVDAVTFAAVTLLPLLAPRLAEVAKIDSIVVHPTCSVVRAGTLENLLAVAGAIAEHVHVPDGWGCCGFAGDRGLLHPELTAAATVDQAVEIRALPGEKHVSSNRTCEIAMTRATGRTYVHVLEALDEHLGPHPHDGGERS